jgi:hypothetical protein
MDVRRKLLWVDGLAAAVAGVAVLLSGSWLSEWYGLPREILLLVGGVNLSYALYSLFLAARAERPKALIILLVIANLVWAFVCLQWAVAFADTASMFGVTHLAGEGVFVGVLASLEWRWRELLRTA